MGVKYSYVVAIYNAERTLRECIESVYNQNVPEKDYELIIVDGGSTDSTLSIVKEFMKRKKNIKLLHNKNKLSEGRGNGKDQGYRASKGNIIIYIDHDNILIGKDWLKEVTAVFKYDTTIMASQSMLAYKPGDNNFLKYVNEIGVEDPFAIPYSLVAQARLHPAMFRVLKKNYLVHTLSMDNVLFGGANGCAFRRECLEKTGGYSRDVDLFHQMAGMEMTVAIANTAFIHHKTSDNMLNFLKKKGLYFYRFISGEYKVREFNWASRGSGKRGTIAFMLMVCYNLGFIGPFFEGIRQWMRSGKAFWLLHGFFVFYLTVLYLVITLLFINNFLAYLEKP